jgi:hypothetical protein
VEELLRCHDAVFLEEDTVLHYEAHMAKNTRLWFPESDGGQKSRSRMMAFASRGRCPVSDTHMTKIGRF